MWHWGRQWLAAGSLAGSASSSAETAWCWRAESQHHWDGGTQQLSVEKTPCAPELIKGF